MKTATEILRRELDSLVGDPRRFSTAEEYHKWCIVEIDRAARELAQEHISALARLAALKPPPPFVIPKEAAINPAILPFGRDSV